jgi:hypothetical protein
VALADVKQAAKALGVSVNDVVLAMAAGALRDLLLCYDGEANEPIIASVPTATDKSDRITGNEISGLSVSLPVHVDDPLERVRLVALATGIAKEDHEIIGPELYCRMMTYLPTAVAPAAFRWLSKTRRAEQDDERRGVQCRRSTGAWPLRWCTGDGDLLDGCAVHGSAGQHHGLELRRPDGHRGVDRRPYLR